jgi:carboxypeptidase C (cathepsin A)
VGVCVAVLTLSPLITPRFTESSGSPKDPVAFWTNGGPGCSGLIGFMTEQGAFKPNADMTLSLNEFAWNKVANMVFIESPAGVGFSYSTDTADYTTGDSQTAVDNYNLIQAFLLRFPDLSTNELYITSESYGGHYMVSSTPNPNLHPSPNPTPIPNPHPNPKP